MVLDPMAEPFIDSAEDLRLLLDSTQDGIFRLDESGRCTFVNRAGADLLGLKPEELLGEPLHARVHHHSFEGDPYPPERCPICGGLGSKYVEVA